MTETELRDRIAQLPLENQQILQDICARIVPALEAKTPRRLMLMLTYDFDSESSMQGNLGFSSLNLEPADAMHMLQMGLDTLSGPLANTTPVQYQ